MEAKEKKEAVGPKPKEVVITAPNMKVASFLIRGKAPMIQERFSKKVEEKMREKHEAGSQAAKGKKREARDFAADCEEATYRDAEGRFGMPVSWFRAAIISACALVGFKMTMAKRSNIRALPDVWDVKDGKGLILITKGRPQMDIQHVRNATGVADLRARPRWDVGWEARVKIEFDADMFSINDVTNLMMRVGSQIGIGAGRPDSKFSAGMDCGLFDLVNEGE